MMFEMRAALHRPSQLHEKCLFTILRVHIHMRSRLQELSNTEALLSRNMSVLSVCSHRIPSYYSWHSVQVDDEGGRTAMRERANTHAYKHLPCERRWRELASSTKQTEQ